MPLENRAGLRAPHNPDCKDCMDAVIHSLSQPLTCLRGPLELSLLGKGSPEAYRAAIEDAVAQADRLFRLLDSFRELTEGPVTAGASEPVALRDLVLDVLNEIPSLIESRQSHVSVESEDEVNLQTDTGRLRSALLKMIKCVVERTPREGQVTVRVSRFNGFASLTFSAQDPSRVAVAGSHAAACSHGLNSPDLPWRCDIEWTIATRAILALGGRIRTSNGARNGYYLQILLPLSLENPAA